MSDALDAAIRAAMEDEGCEIINTGSHDYPVHACLTHQCRVDSGACSLIADAVTVGFKAGRRDALAEVRECLDEHPEICDRYGPDEPISCGWKWAVADVRHLLSTAEEAKR